VLAPKAEKLFVQGVTAYMQGRYADGLSTLQEVESKDTSGQHVGEEFFAGMCLVGLDRAPEAIPYFEAVLASDHSIPDPLMTKYRVGGNMEIGVTATVSAMVPMSNLAVALILAEVYQRTDQRQKAIDLLETLGAGAPDGRVFALSLADLYFEGDQWDDLVRVTEGVQANEDDGTLNILIFRAWAMRELGMTTASLELTKEALRTKKRNPILLRFARYARGRTYDNMGKAAMARKEYEKVYAEDATFWDVSERLGRATPPVQTALPPPPGA
jgi:tetratricopeptide (TPR) repeat protein